MVKARLLNPLFSRLKGHVVEVVRECTGEPIQGVRLEPNMRYFLTHYPGAKEDSLHSMSALEFLEEDDG